MKEDSFVITHYYENGVDALESTNKSQFVQDIIDLLAKENDLDLLDGVKLSFRAWIETLAKVSKSFYINKTGEPNKVTIWIKAPNDQKTKKVRYKLHCDDTSVLLEKIYV